MKRMQVIGLLIAVIAVGIVVSKAYKADEAGPTEYVFD